MDTNNIDVVRAIVKAARPSDAKRAPPRKPQKPPPALQRAAALVQGVDACESALKRCARAYAMPDDDSAMTDAARDDVDARVRALLRECQAALEEPSSDNGKPGSREAHARGGVEVARARTAALAATSSGVMRIMWLAGGGRPPRRVVVDDAAYTLRPYLLPYVLHNNVVHFIGESI